MLTRSFLKTVFTRLQKARALNFKSSFAAQRGKKRLAFWRRHRRCPPPVIYRSGARRARLNLAPSCVAIDRVPAARAKGGAMLASVKFSAELRRCKDASTPGLGNDAAAVRWSLIG